MNLTLFHFIFVCSCLAISYLLILLSLISLSCYLLSPYLLIFGSYPIGGYLDHILLIDKSWLV